MAFRSIEPLALESRNIQCRTGRCQRSTNQDLHANSTTTRKIMKEVQILRNVRDMRSFARCLPDRIPVPQSRDAAGCVCSSRRITRSVRGQSMSADALFRTVAARLQHQEEHIRLYCFLCWSFITGIPMKDITEFQIVEDDDGMPFYSCMTLSPLSKEARPRSKEARPSGFALGC